MNRSVILLLLAMHLICTASAQTVFPTNWWVGMKETKLQLLVHQPGIGAAERKVRVNYPGVQQLSIERLQNPNYLVVNLNITKAARPGRMSIAITGTDFKLTLPYELSARHKENGKTRVQGVAAKDFVYLMIPDRFANGDTSNDIIRGYREETSDRANKFSRHGGDFSGIEKNLPYLNDLGVTTVWMTPVIENNTSLMHEWGNSVAGYHGYWFTNHYEVDKRLGGNDGYLRLSNTLHSKGMKLIQDAVYNHVSLEHWIALDPPEKDWINNWPKFTGPNHREETLFDPYASAYDKKKMLDGWFVDHLPDLNQRNKHVATYLIQHAIWTTEKYGIDGWRVDTYKYCDEQFLNDVNNALEREFPKITIFGEAWVNTIIGNAYFTKNNITTGFHHNANGVIDFQTCFAMLSGMNKAQGWSEGVNKIYMTMAQDIIYKDPTRNCIFLDNHDMDRVFSVVGEDWKKLKMGLNWLLTLRGIPQLYYGTEVLMKNMKTTSDALVREDFPGGWAGDSGNRFTEAGRTPEQNTAFNHVRALGNFRKTSTALTAGKTMQFIPVNNLYVYFRYNKAQTVMVAANTGTEVATPDWSSFIEITKGFTKARDVVSGKTIDLKEITVPAGESFVFELLK